MSRIVGGSFYCSCNKLTTLENSPQSVGGDFWCDNNTTKFIEEDVRNVCEVKGEIDV